MKIFRQVFWVLVLAGAFVFLGGIGLGYSANRAPVGPLLDGLGDLKFPVTTESALAQRYFNQGLTLCYAFNHQEAIRSFQSAANLDPDCAMAYWGKAYAFGPHVNKPMDAAANKEAWMALQGALARMPKAGAKEQALISALSERYRPEFQEERGDLDKAYANAMRKVAQQYPDDLDIQVMFAEALMDTMPWDYWLDDRSPKPDTEEAIGALRFVMARDPNHPGANHLYIHAVEAGPNPQSGLAAADRLLNYAPSAGHLVHMPSHIYMRVGLYTEAVEANEKAVKADQDYLRQTRLQGFYPGMYYPHNIHFLWWAQLYEGRSQEASKTAQQAARYAVDNYCGPIQVVEAPRFRHLPWLTQMRFGQTEDLMKVPQPPATNDLLLDRAVWHFTRGVSFAAEDQLDNASNEQQALREIATGEVIKELDNPLLPVSSIVAIADHWLAARVAELEGDEERMRREFERAIAIEDGMPYMEPAYWPIHVRPAYGAALLRTGQPAGAEKIFREDLSRMPRNGWGLYGLEHALRAQNRIDSADAVHRQFEQTWKNADTELELRWF
ncbi:MAG: tetratricopeptide repeat protein [Limisphaerales bacterium]